MRTFFLLLIFNSLIFANENKSTNDNFVLVIFLIILSIFIILLFRNNLFLSKQKIHSDKEKEKFKTLLDYASDGVHILDSNGNIYACSKTFYKLLGYSELEIEKNNIFNIDINLNEDKYKQLLDKLINEPQTYITEYKKLNSSLLPVEVSAKSIMIENETYIYASSRDITERIKFKKELQYERDLLDTLFDNAEAIVATIDKNGVMNKVNKYTEKLTGYTEEQIASRPYFWFDNFIPTDIKPDIKAIFESLTAIDGNKELVTKAENEWIVKNGEKRLFEWSNKIIYENNEAKFLLTMGIDITDRKKFENELKHLNEDLEERVKEATKKLNHSLEIIEKNVIGSKTDLKGIITEVTDRFCEISKYSREELIGKNHNIIRHEDMPNSFFKELWKTIKAGKTWTGVIKNKNKDNEPYWVDSVISPLYDVDNKNIIGYYSYRIDVTQEVLNRQLQEKHNKELEEKVKYQLEEIREKDLKMLEQAKLASLGELSTNISHHWRQPLSVISICSTGIKYSLEYGGLTNEEILEQLSSINESCDFLTNTIESFDKYLNKNNKFDNFEITNEIKSAKFILQTPLKAEYIELKDEIDYTKHYRCHMIENSLSQVLINIISNSIDAFSKKDSSYDRWIKLYSYEKENRLVICVQDNAGGIPEEHINRVFEPYFTTKHKSQGTGLGLSLSYSIVVNDIKGDLYVKNTNEGALFSIELPL